MALSDAQRHELERCLELATGLYRRGHYAVARDIMQGLEAVLDERQEAS